MSITNKDIESLASLARIKVSPDELDSLAKEMDSILEYVGKIEVIKEEATLERPILRNVMREDVVTTKPGEYTEELLKLAPSREKNYIKVKKILE